MRIAAAQIDIIAANPEANFNSIKEFVLKAIAESSVDMVVFPELTLPGYLMGDIWEELSFLDECDYWLNEVKKLAENNNIYILVGSVARTNDVNFDGRVKKFNAMYLFTPGGTTLGTERDVNGLNFIPKTLLPNYREFDEPRHFSSNMLYVRNHPVFSIGDGGKKINIGISICEDGWDRDYPVKPIADLVKAGAKFIINCSCSPFTSGKNARRNQVFGLHAKTHKVPLLYVNAVGLQNNGKTVYTFDGCSVLYDKTGSIVHQAGMFVQDMFIMDTDCYIAYPEVPVKRVVTTEIGEIFESLVYGIRKFCRMSGIQKVVIGSSGGIDSAVSAALHVLALGNENVYLVNMPSQYNSETTKGLSAELAKNLKCPYATVPIGDSVELTKKQIDGLHFIVPLVSEDRPSRYDIGEFIRLSDFNLENVQARDRSSRILAAISSAMGAVYSNNGNKCEFTVGYCTIGGDLSGYLCVIGDLWKEQVYLLGRYINHLYGNMIPEGIFNIVASAELSDAQSIDQGKGDPLIYWYHDRLFKSWVQDWNRKSPEDIISWYIEGTIDEELDLPKNQFGQRKSIRDAFKTNKEFVDDLENWWKQFKSSVFKRVQAPPVLAVSKRAFGFDYRESLNCLLFTTKYKTLREKLLG